MRDLIKHPITDEEAINILTIIQNSFGIDLIGDMRPVIISEIISKFQSGDFTLQPPNIKDK